MDYHIPPRILESLEAYKQGRSLGVGGFLMAVLTNDLIGTVRRADSDSAAAMLDIVSYVWNELPGDSWGTPEKVRAWLDKCQHDVQVSRERME